MPKRPSDTLITTLPDKRQKAAIVVLCRNSDLNEMIDSMQEFEASFNGKYRYPYIFFNDVPFTEEFKLEISKHTNSTISFNTIPKDEWSVPSHINLEKMQASMDEMQKNGVMYGGLLSYRLMCRWFSGFFFRNEALKDHEWYWRLEPGVKFFCKVNYDPFVYMQENGKQYGFNVALYELPETIPTLWDTIKEFALSNGISNSTMLRFFARNDASYSRCHFWSNFEIASLSVWRSETYLAYFNYLDRAGGFFYERWGDAPVHSIYLGLMLEKSQLHFFADIGYEHAKLEHCMDHGKLASICSCPRFTLHPFAMSSGSCYLEFREYKQYKWTFGASVWDLEPYKHEEEVDAGKTESVLWDKSGMNTE